LGAVIRGALPLGFCSSVVDGMDRDDFDKNCCADDFATRWRFLSVNPLIFYCKGCIPFMVFVHRKLRGRPALLLRSNNWIETRSREFVEWRTYYEHARQYYPEHEVIFLSNCEKNTRRFIRYGLPAVFCHQGGLVDEHAFRIDRAARKEFAAIYTAQALPFKRLELAAAIDSLAIITYNTRRKDGYFEQIRELLKHANWLNYPGRQRYVRPDVVAGYLNRARAGLILSSVEGGNYANVEYMLCGLPVISTKCIGGRHVFFDKRYTRIVAPDARAVAQAVQELIAAGIEPESVRQSALEKVRHHRKIFVDLLQDYCRRGGVERDIAGEWPALFLNKMLDWRIAAAFDEEWRKADASEKARVSARSENKPSGCE
jgi:glycosyltransferase involved in cell wall biosynthesis